MVRECGSCTLCCKVMGIGELGKPLGQWCPHCDIGKGCKIYAAKPPSCTDFNCLWLINEGLGPEWQPSKSKIVLVADAKNHRIIAYVDPATPTVWKRSPYFEKLREWMLSGMRPDGDSVFISIAGKVTLLLPDGEHPLGAIRNDDVVEVQMIGGAYRAVVKKGARG